MWGPGNWPHSSVSIPVIARIPFVAWRISAGVRLGFAPSPPGSLRIAIVPPVKRITIIRGWLTATDDYSPRAVGGSADGCGLQSPRHYRTRQPLFWPISISRAGGDAPHRFVKECVHLLLILARDRHRLRDECVDGEKVKCRLSRLAIGQQYLVEQANRRLENIGR